LENFCKILFLLSEFVLLFDVFVIVLREIPNLSNLSSFTPVCSFLFVIALFIVNKFVKICLINVLGIVTSKYILFKVILELTTELVLVIKL
jgi:hypothetical protein